MYGDLNIFDDRIIHVGMSSVSMNQSQEEKSTRLLGSTGSLIDDVLNKAEAQFKSIQSVAMVEYPMIISKIAQDRISDDASIIEGSVEVLATIQSFYPRKKQAKITLNYPIRFGVLKDANFFKTSIGKTFSFTAEGIKIAMRLKSFNEKVLDTKRFQPAQLSLK